MGKIKDIVFDVGRVLVDFKYDNCFRFLSEKGARFSGIDDFARRTDLRSYEYGHISSETYLANVSRLMSCKVERSELISQWVEIFEPIPEMLSLATKLRADHGVFFLSNTSALHWEYLLSEYHLDQVAKGVMASFEVGALKPEPKIFHEAEKRFTLTPENTLFIDDIEENAMGAISCGWHAIHHVSVEKTMERLEALLSLK